MMDIIEGRNSKRQPEEMNYFIYFQHLRKAGGTHFCNLTQQNIPQQYVPQYYCMPDHDWIPPISDMKSRNMDKKFNYQDPNSLRKVLLQRDQSPTRMSNTNVIPCEGGCLNRYSNDEIIRYMPHYKIASNEWEYFGVSRHHLDLPAIFVTSFRHPIQRAISQYRFECADAIVKRCGSDDHLSNDNIRSSLKNSSNHGILQYWNRRRDLHNIYTSTFSDFDTEMSSLDSRDNVMHPTSQQQQQQQKQQQQQQNWQRSNAVGIAYDTITRFHLVLIMELLPYSEPLIHDILQFHNTSLLQQRIFPVKYAVQQRSDRTTGMTEHDLSPEEYSIISESLALDEILYDVARRVFLERLVCTS
jgi:hypothetical protein